MLNALLTENKPHCPVCQQRDYAVKEYKEIEHQGNHYTQIIARCNCDAIFKYCARITIEKEEYFIFDDEEIKETKKELLE